MSTNEQNAASEQLRAAVKNAIFTLADQHTHKSIELKSALHVFLDWHKEREANKFLMEEVLEALARAPTNVRSEIFGEGYVAGFNDAKAMDKDNARLPKSAS
jgi:hypothetical protein